MRSFVLAVLAMIKGPEGSPYQGGIFYLDVKLPEIYPFKRPIIQFRTKIYHCNVNELGGIALDILGDEWAPALTIKRLLLSIIDLLRRPNLDDAISSSIREQYSQNREEHDRIAQEWTATRAAT
jgi:ubiquitin-conjugating enzyme E2 D/E